MIAAFLALGLAQSLMVDVQSSPEPGFAISAVAPVEAELGPYGRATAAVLVEMMRGGTSSYTVATLRRTSAEGNSRFTVDLLPDSIRIGLGSTKLDEGLSMLFSLATEYKSDRGAFQSAMETVGERPRDAWSLVQRPEKLNTAAVRYEDVLDLAAQVLSPARIKVGIVGDTTATTASDLWSIRAGAWPTLKRRDPMADRSGFSLIQKTDANFDIVAFRGPEFGSAQPVGAKLLALSALGLGKSSSLFQVVREKSGGSYQQMAILSPTGTGFRCQLLIAHSGSGAQELAEVWRKDLREDVGSWDEARIGTARTWLASSLSGDLPVGLLALSGGQPLGHSASDRAFLLAYWWAKTGRQWNGGQVLSADADLKEVQEAALEILEAPPVIFRGK